MNKETKRTRSRGKIHDVTRGMGFQIVSHGLLPDHPHCWLAANINCSSGTRMWDGGGIEWGESFAIQRLHVGAPTRTRIMHISTPIENPSDGTSYCLEKNNVVALDAPACA